jgi:hypothetical protein
MFWWINKPLTTYVTNLAYYRAFEEFSYQMLAQIIKNLGKSGLKCVSFSKEPYFTISTKKVGCIISKYQMSGFC